MSEFNNNRSICVRSVKVHKVIKDVKVRKEDNNNRSKCVRVDQEGQVDQVDQVDQVSRLRRYSAVACLPSLNHSRPASGVRASK